MIAGMTTVKRAVTIDEDVERDARALAGSNFSAFVNDALRRQIRAVKLGQLVAADATERGAVPEREVRAVAAELERLDRA
jgi:hypothetical protein